MDGILNNGILIDVGSRAGAARGGGGGGEIHGDGMKAGRVGEWRWRQAVLHGKNSPNQKYIVCCWKEEFN